MDPKTKLSPHFSLGELIYSSKAVELGIDNTPPPEVLDRLIIVCCRILEPVREHYGVSFSPNSGYRCHDLNKAIGGSENSQHMIGQAVDFEVPGVSNYDLALWISKNLEFDQLILERYTPGNASSGWVHCSIISGQNRRMVMTMNGAFTKHGLIA